MGREDYAERGVGGAGNENVQLCVKRVGWKWRGGRGREGIRTWPGQFTEIDFRWLAGPVGVNEWVGRVGKGGGDGAQEGGGWGWDE